MQTFNLAIVSDRVWSGVVTAQIGAGTAALLAFWKLIAVQQKTLKRTSSYCHA